MILTSPNVHVSKANRPHAFADRLLNDLDGLYRHGFRYIVHCSIILRVRKIVHHLAGCAQLHFDYITPTQRGSQSDSSGQNVTSIRNASIVSSHGVTALVMSVSPNRDMPLAT